MTTNSIADLGANLEDEMEFRGVQGLVGGGEATSKMTRSIADSRANRGEDGGDEKEKG